VESVCGEFGNPELLALRRDGPAQTLYRVAFRQKDVWGAAECADADAANDVIEVRARARARERARMEVAVFHSPSLSLSPRLSLSLCVCVCVEH
jgi:hypothetical protein